MNYYLKLDDETTMIFAFSSGKFLGGPELGAP